MAVLFNDGIRAGASAGGGDAYQVAKSLRFDGGDDAHLNKTFASGGSTTTWTLSFWIKGADIAQACYVFTGGTGTSSYITMDVGQFRFYSSAHDLKSEARYRDPSAWYHFVVVADTTNGTDNDKTRVYVNGTRLAVGDFATHTQPSASAALGDFNSAAAHYFNRLTTGSQEDMMLAEVHFVDAAAKEASDFGETNADTGQWLPKKYAGSYGTTGFYLKFDDIYDDSGTLKVPDNSTNSNEWTANNLTVSGHVNMPCVSFDGSGDYLSIPDSADFTVGSDPFTIEFWAYKTSSGEDNIMGSSDSGGSTASLSYAIQTGSSSPSNSLCAHVGDGSSLHTCNSGVDFVLNRWVHVAFVRDGNTLRLFQNGIQMDTTSFSGTVKDSADSFFIGRGGNFSGTKDFPGYISNFHFVKGTALYTANFTPSTTATKHANTKLLCCQSSSSATEENSDSSHTITASGDAAATTKSDDTIGDDQFIDSPTTFDDEGRGTGNYCTWNPLDSRGLTLSQGNLRCTQGGNSWERAFGTMGMKTGKWYWEITKEDNNSSEGSGVSGNSIGFGITNVNDPNRGSSATGSHYTMLSYAANHYDNGITRTYTPANQVPTSGGNESQSGVWMIAMDLDNGKGWTGKDGTWLKEGGTGGNPATGADPCFYNFIPGATYFPMLTHFFASNVTANFGQRAFEHTPPSGFKALNTYNLPDPTITDPSKHFDVETDDGADILSTGTGLTDGADFVWIKDKANSSTNHILFNRVNDSGMDGTPHLRANNTDSEATAGTYSAPSGASVAWVWNAGSSNTSVSAGGLNSSAYDTSEDWSATFANDQLDTTDVGQAFRGITTATGAGLPSDGFLSLTDVAFDVTSTISLWVQDPGSIAVLMEYNGTTYTNSSPNKYGWTDFTVPAGSNSGTLKAKLASSSDEIRGVKIDGKILVDSNITPPNMPSIASTNRVNTDAGFSIVSYTGNNTAGATISHGLNAVPSFMIVKERESTGGWVVYHKDYGGQKYLYLHSSASIATSSSPWNNSPPTSTVLSVGSWSGVNGTTDHIAYCWSEVEGYSKFGTYTGNGNTTDGPFCYCGFRPRYVITKGADANDWFIRDTARSPYNVIDNPLRQDTGNEYSGREADILSNGFKLRASGDWAQVNTDGVLYYWAAFADNPFKYANAR